MSGNKAKSQLDINHETSGRIPMTSVATERDQEFYFDDSLVVIQVENALFRVHRFQLVKSETFSDMFKVPNGPTELEEGASPERPIILEGVKASDFRALLKVLYADYFPNKKPKCEPEIIVPAFRLAHMWNFSDLRTRLLPLVKDSIGCVDKIVLGRELGIQEWLVPAYVELCQREESLTAEEGTKLGIHSTVMVFRLREKFRVSQSIPTSVCTEDYCGGCLNNRFYGNHGASHCRGCNRHMGSSSYWRIYVNAPGLALPSVNDGLENQVKKWVEGGCIPE